MSVARVVAPVQVPLATRAAVAAPEATELAHSTVASVAQVAPVAPESRALALRAAVHRRQRVPRAVTVEPVALAAWLWVRALVVPVARAAPVVSVARVVLPSRH